MQHDATSTVSALTPPLQPGERVSALVTGPHRPPTEVLGFVTDLTPETLTLIDRRGALHTASHAEVAALRRVPLARGRRPQSTPRDLLDALAERAQAPGTPWVARITDLLAGLTPPATVPPWGPTASFADADARAEGEWVTVAGGTLASWRAAAWWATRMGARSVQVRVPGACIGDEALTEAGFTRL
ncbi:MAG TPA: hypothetical protein PLK46_01385 [Propioniciclava sp.]|jgi:hypothetical protein|uniref:hypothetical protein n=1 Tax=Propioniciclava sp. TaxID=2038686 RepID=UPI002BD3DB3D|nr:hypothetical protein [Propioniciclava sp.]HRL48485.1 hypothetical protein [Propioniciclava sp.]HRL78967.1 hypothetical protein [Propioniciclava sp.]